MKFYLGKDVVIACQIFAKNVLRTNIDEYRNRNQFDEKKIQDDITIGKLAEWGVFFIYVNRGRHSVTLPDMRILGVKDKSFDCDLSWDLFRLHIKSQTEESANRYGSSWIFQNKDPLFGYSNEYDIIVGCSVTLDKDTDGFLKGAFVEIQLEKQFKSLKFSDTKLNKFGGSKKAVYLKENND